MLAEQVNEMLSMHKQHGAHQLITSEVGDAAVSSGFRTGYG